MTTITMLDAALMYAAQGCRVFPVDHRTGKPLIAGNLKAATTDKRLITEWWTRWPKAHIGGAMGELSGCFALDIDNKTDRNGFASLAALEAKHGPLPTNTYRSRTPSGGEHRFFDYPKGTWIPNRSNDIGPGLDIRGGQADGSSAGYVRLPPSRREDGAYQPINYCGLIYAIGPRGGLVAAPDWFLFYVIFKISERELYAKIGITGAEAFDGAHPSKWMQLAETALVRAWGGPRVAPGEPLDTKTADFVRNYISVGINREIEAIAAAGNGDQEKTLNQSGLAIHSLLAGARLRGLGPGALAEIEARAKERYLAAGVDMRAFKPREPWTMAGVLAKWCHTQDGAEPRNLFGIGGTAADREFADFLELREPPKPKIDSEFKLYTARSAVDIKPEAIEWIWPDRIPRGVTSIVGGMPGLGKSQFMFALAAAITTGGILPDGSRAELGNVVLVNAEDHPEKTLIPRLIAAGADLTRVHLLEGCYDPEKPQEMRRFDVRQMPALKQLIRDVGNVALVAIDPVMAYLPGGKDSNKDDEVRAALSDLNQMAEEENFAVVLVTHLNKGNGGHVLDRFMGSRAFTGLPRSAWLITSDPDDDTEQRCIFSLAKTNVGPKVPGIAYSVTTVTVQDGIQAQKLTFESEPEYRKARELLNPEQSSDQKSQVDQACDWLKDALRDGPKESKQLAKEAKDAWISNYCFKAARKKLGVRPMKGDGPNAPWVMALPAQVMGTNPDEEFADMVGRLDPDQMFH